MPVCKNCGNKRKFTQHGFPKDFGFVVLSCALCKSYDVKNTRFEDICFTLGLIGLAVLLSPLILLVSLLFPFKRSESSK